MKKQARLLYILCIIVISIALDQGSKVLVRETIAPRTETALGERIPLLGETFIMMNVENEGAFLGLGSELSKSLKILLLNILPIVVLLFVLRYILKDKTLNRWSLCAFSMIIGGGIANIYDRIKYGSVTDFFFIDLGGVFKTGVFNVADMAVSAGMIMLLIASFKKEKKPAV